MIRIYSHTDWLSLSFKMADTARAIMPSNIDSFKSGGKPSKLYPLVQRMESGARVSFGNSEHQGCLVDMTGSVLRWYRDKGLGTSDMLAYAANHPLRRNVTRLDFCWNYVGDAGESRIGELVSAYEQGLHETTFRNKPELISIPNENSGKTFYFGSRKANYRVRCYDKMAEIGGQVDGVKFWDRVEIQVRKKEATTLAVQCDRDGVGKVMSAKLVRKLDFPTVGWWRAGLEDTEVDLDVARKRDDGWQEWITDQVTPSILNRASDPAHREFIEKWLLELRKAIS